jgi:arylsulfatase A-like enzyme
LTSLGVAENTLVIFLGDNGSDAPLGHEHAVACAAPLRGKKGAHYEGGMRVPFIAAWAKPTATNAHQTRLPIGVGKIQTQQAAVYDIAPTVLNLCGVQAPAEHKLDGSALDKLLTGERDPQRAETFLMHYPHGPHRSSYFTVYREGPWKVIYHYFPSPASEGSHYQLFHLGDDPFEQQNLATSRSDELARMTKGLIAALQRCDAVYPVAEGGSERVKPKLP